MAKAILEMDMPQNCYECVLSTKKHYNQIDWDWVCGGLNNKIQVDIFGEHRTKRHPSCPLKPVEENNE